MTATPIPLSVVWISYRGREPLLRSLGALAGRVSQRIVVDNASNDGTVEAVARADPGCHVIAHRRNRGYAAAVNAGLAAAREDWILLLNGDALVDSDELPNLWTHGRLEQDAISGFAQCNPTGRVQLTWGDAPGWRSEWRRRGLERRFRQGGGALPQRPIDVDWVAGSCMLFPRTVVDRVGPWDERFFLYFEDIDWCLRARRAGVGVRFVPGVRVTHLHGHSAQQQPLDAEIHYRQSQLLFWYLHRGPASCAWLRRYLLLRHGLGASQRRRRIRETLLGWRPPEEASCASSM